MLNNLLLSIESRLIKQDKVSIQLINPVYILLNLDLVYLDYFAFTGLEFYVTNEVSVFINTKHLQFIYIVYN